jgi:Outer membrane protein beta-barrel domain
MAPRTFSVLAVLVVSLAAPLAVVAQERAPHAGSGAVGFDIGAYVPKDDRFDNSMILDVLYEYYLTPRVSLRTGFGWADPSFKREATDGLRQIPLKVDLNYNWERGKWHPFVGAGAGAYFLQARDNNQSFGESQTKAGFNLGGGIEYFTGRTISIKGEGRYQTIGKTTDGLDSSGLALTVGVKRYF